MRSESFLVVDFETFYDRKGKYSLRDLTTHEYVMDDRFEVMSVAVKPVGHDGVVVPGERAAELFATLPMDQCVLVGHNLHFDGYILAQRFGIKPKLYIDTMMLAMATLGGRVPRMSLKAVHEYLYGGEAKKGSDALVKADGRRWADLSDAERQALLRYNYSDVVETEEVFLKLMPQFPMTHEVELLDWAVRAACWPKIHLDAELLEAELKDVRRKRRELVKTAGVDRSVLSSNDKFVEYLQSLGVDVPTKISQTTGKRTYALARKDEEFIALKEHEDERVRAAVEARLTVKSTIAETRAAKFLRMARMGRPVPAPILYAGAVNTGRFSGAGGLNFQNIPKKGQYWDDKVKEWKEGKSLLRLAVRPPEGHKVVVADSSNIELRVCHYIAGETAVLAAARENRDAYCEFASLIYGTEVNPEAFEEGSPEREKHDKMRALGKVAMLALQYGMGYAKYMDTVRDWTGTVLDEAEAQRTVTLFRSTYPRIKLLWKRLDTMLRMAAQAQLFQSPRTFFPELPVDYYMAEVDGHHELRGRLPGGFELKYPRIRLSDMEEVEYYRPYKQSVERPWAKIYGGLATENATQALAAAIIREQMCAIMHRLEGELGLSRDHLVLQVHDEVVLMVPEDLTQATIQVVEQEMSKAPSWAPGLPLACEAKAADSYGAAK